MYEKIVSHGKGGQRPGVSSGKRDGLGSDMSMASANPAYSGSEQVLLVPTHDSLPKTNKSEMGIMLTRSKCMSQNNSNGSCKKVWKTIYANQEVVMKNFRDITRIGSVALVFTFMSVAGSVAFMSEGRKGTSETGRHAGFYQGAAYDIMQVSQNNGLPQRFLGQGAGRSIQALPGGKGVQRHHMVSQRRSQTVLPIILYPWKWGYNYGEMQTPEEVLVEYLEEIYNQQAMTTEEDPAEEPPVQTSPPLIIEERCGKYVQVPWPEPGGVLFEPIEEPTCP